MLLGSQMWGDSETGPGNALIDMRREIDCLHSCAIQATNYRSQTPSHSRASMIYRKWRVETRELQVSLYVFAMLK